MFGIIGRLLVLLPLSCSLLADTLQVSHRSSSKMQQSRPIVELMLSKQEFFVGECVPFTLRVTYDAHAYDVQNMVQPQGTFMVFKQISKSKKWRDTVTERWVVEWEGNFYATHSGRFECGPFQVLLQQRISHNTSSWSLFMSQHAITLESNVVTCNVLSLPEAPDHALHPIGQFTSAHLEVDQIDFQAGQAITLRMHIAGAGHVLSDSYPQVSLPEGLKWYFSKMHQDADGVTFEYVIQALHDAVFVVPAQNFIFFDPEAKKYKILKTESIRLYVAPNPNPSMPILVDPSGEELPAQLSDSEKEQKNLAQAPLLRTLYIPDLYIVIVLLLVLISACIYRLRRYIYDLQMRIYKKWKYRMLIREARKKIRFFSAHSLKKREDMLYFYEIFKKLQSEVDWEHLHITEEGKVLYEDWKNFWHQVSYDRFVHGDDNNISRELIQQAAQWLSFFEKKIV